MSATDPTHIPLEGVIGSRVSGALPESVAQPSSILVTVEGSARQTLEQARTRLLVVGALFSLALLVVGGKLVGLAVLGQGENTHAHYAPPPVQPVRATRGKWLRAEPVAALYAQGRVRHVGALPELEDEMADFGLDGLSAGRSPDRLDALVWALTALMLAEAGEPRVRGM